MKNQILTLLIVFIFCSCDKNDNNSLETSLTGKWELTQTTGSIPNSEKTGANMEWQEYYVLKANKTFIKSRTRNGISTTVSGTYTIAKSPNENVLTLTYKNESDIIGSCISNIKEELYLNPENIMYSSWSICDGPGLKYEKVN
jgi:hypothetical protein